MSEEQPQEAWPTYDPASGDAPPAPAGTTCTACGGEQFEPGFLEERADSSSGFIRWIVGPLERGVFGGAKRMGRVRLELTGRRCVGCGHIELFANNKA